jgi:hypothetical protein
MTEKTIEHIIYRLKKSKLETGKGAIVLLGAGCSITAGIPSAGKLVLEILESSKDNPDIKRICNQEPSYANLMECLNARERNAIFKRYVDQASINASHIYLAQLMKEGFVDYIVTVNFDNLAQRALALYNIFPPVYDISILRDITTTSLETQSIIHLHGHYNGLWQLNTREEMQKVNIDGVAKSIFDRITHDRPWIVIGYSGDDFIFDELIKYKRFDNDLFWVGYKDNDPSDNVCSKLLNQPNCGASLIRGHDSDAFFLSLSTKLCDGHPKIFKSPFSFLSDLYKNIVDIEDDDKYKRVKKRFEDSKKHVLDAIQRYEIGVEEKEQMTTLEIHLSNLKQGLIDCIVSDNYDSLEAIEREIHSSENSKQLSFSNAESELTSLLNDCYFNWGNNLYNSTNLKTSKEKEKLLIESCQKYELAIKYKAEDYEAYDNWGIALRDLSDLRTEKEKEKLLIESCQKYKSAINYKKDDYRAYDNWGVTLLSIAKLKTGEEKEKLLIESCQKYELATNYKKDDSNAYANWASGLIILAQLKTGNEKQMYLKLALEKSKLCKDLGGNGYNLACCYALLKQKGYAFINLKESLEKREITLSHVQQDTDWDDLRTEPEYLELIALFGD